MAGPRKLRRGIYLLPTSFTTGNLCCGFFSLIESARGHYELAAILIIAAGILDGLDGRIARLTGTASEFGVEFDSLADIASFGIAPAFLAYEWALQSFHRVGWLIAFLFVACAATRLARFNLQHGTSDKRFFAGLPSPAAAGTIASVAFAFPDPPSQLGWSVLVGVLVSAAALLMVSHVRYRSFKGIDLRSPRSYLSVLAIVLALVVVLVHPRSMMVLAGFYLLWGPAGWLAGWLGRGRAGRAAAAHPAEEAVDGPSAR
ncbi:MAG TPA: CDP-diacylglycerol--serine O-phosphatidyltransferase [Candidatus Polarisedimenticolaceae bacterium]|nr:CDP-diacylglycerol--serine O-phosphatidyltransferase [Candidatus Polarisedimenticolaceae bacterium]